MASNRKSIEVKGETYTELYDENGNLPGEFAMAGKSHAEVKKIISDFERFGLIKITVIEGVEYYAVTGGEPEEVPFNVLNIKE